MGKEKKARSHQPLTQQLLGADAPRAARRAKNRPDKSHHEEDEDGYVESKLTHRILEQARRQQEELEGHHAMAGPRKRTKQAASVAGKISLDAGAASSGDDEDSEGEFDLSGEEGGLQDFCPTVTDEDEQAMQRFMSSQEQPRQTLADLIMEKIRDRETEIASQRTDTATQMPQIDEKVMSVFKGVGKILTKYRSGKLPKAFKVIPSLPNWEEILYITEPDSWSAAAMFQATRIFISNLSVNKAQRFFNLVLLPRVRDDIGEYKRLNFHLYMALKKALFKPAAFFKGILLPICESGTCSLREALIISSVLTKTSIPMLHSSAALLKIAEMEYSGGNSIFIRALLDKKYALPYRVIDAIVFHFVRFTSDERNLPTLWHQSLLTFVQRYKEDMAVEQKEAIIELLRWKSHHEITAEVRREIVNSKCRDLGETFINRTGVSMQTEQ